LFDGPVLASDIENFAEIVKAGGILNIGFLVSFFDPSLAIPVF